MSAPAFEQLPLSESPLSPKERARWISEVGALLKYAGAPGDWGYGSQLGILTKHLHRVRAELSSDAAHDIEAHPAEALAAQVEGRATAEVSAVESNTAGAAIAAGAVYAELPMQFACSGVFPVYSADQMRAFADGTHALRTKSEASREFLERMLSAMEGVIDVADRKTAEFDALRSCVVDLTLMLFKPEALRASRGQAPAGATLGLPIAQEPKYTVTGAHIVNRATGEAVPHDEPVFVFRARDALGVRALEAYLALIGEREPSSEHAEAVRGRIADFQRFAASNPARMKWPDTTAQAKPDAVVLEDAAREVLAEVARATAKFPTWPTDPLHAVAVLGEEFGELTKDMLQLTYEPLKTDTAKVRTEALQTAAMALRLFVSLDRYEYRPSVQHSQQEGGAA